MDVSVILIKVFGIAAVGRSVDSGGAASLRDTREAMVNAAVDAVSSFTRTAPGGGARGVLAPANAPLRLFPLYVLGLLKHVSALHTASIRYLLPMVVTVCSRLSYWVEV